MSDNLLKVLHNQDGLEITFIVDEGVARIEFKSNDSIDLSATDDVVVVLNGRGFEAQVHDRKHSVVALGLWDAVDQPAQLMIRVHEYFDGWELE